MGIHSSSSKQTTPSIQMALSIDTKHLGILSVEYGPNDSLLDIKNKLEELQGVPPSRQEIYCKGFLIDEDTVPVKDLVEMTGNSFFPESGRSWRHSQHL